MPNDSNTELQYSQIYDVRILNPEDKIVLNVSFVRKIKEEYEKAKKTVSICGSTLR